MERQVEVSRRLRRGLSHAKGYVGAVTRSSPTLKIILDMGFQAVCSARAHIIYDPNFNLFFSIP
jgi:hypothetical protein